MVSSSACQVCHSTENPFFVEQIYRVVWGFFLNSICYFDKGNLILGVEKNNNKMGQFISFNIFRRYIYIYIVQMAFIFQKKKKSQDFVFYAIL